MFFTVLFYFFILVDNIESCVVSLISYCEQIAILNLFKINVFLYDMDQLCLVCFFFLNNSAFSCLRMSSTTSPTVPAHPVLN